MDADLAAAVDRLRAPDGHLWASAGDRFQSLFGRDSLITALQLMPHDPAIAIATLDVLGRHLGQQDDPAREEEPGKVPHEVRDGDLAAYTAHGWPVRDGRLRYYGSVDATAWYVIVYAALARAGAAPVAVRPCAERAATWLACQPQPLRYQRRNQAAGLEHQSWRDVAWDLQGNGHGVVDDAGHPLVAPVALASVAALAWRALADAAEVLGPAHEAARDGARRAFDDTFGAAVPAFAVHDGGSVVGATSDLGHVLWTGILGRTAAAEATAARLAEPDLFTSHGLRTLPSGHPAFSVTGYHTGAVWPFDTWLGAGGMAPVDRAAAAALLGGVAAAVTEVGGFPELYGVDLDGHVVPSPEACRVQAWTVGAVAAARTGWDGRSWAT